MKLTLLTLSLAFAMTLNAAPTPQPEPLPQPLPPTEPVPTPPQAPTQPTPELTTAILGHWQYDGFFSEEKRFPPPNPSLILTFTFTEDGQHRLYWHRTDVPSAFCERKGTWEITRNILKQTTTWLNPGNAQDCGADPDMQADRVSENEIHMETTPEGEFLNLHMQLDGKPFLYILKRVEKPAP